MFDYAELHTTLQYSRLFADKGIGLIYSDRKKAPTEKQNLNDGRTIYPFFALKIVPATFTPMKKKLKQRAQIDHLLSDLQPQYRHD